uniref:Uncharacterized protein n=1 Tax=Sipha flava TaxID=143950 RepID=A0A2S2QAK4_9HEMI
MMALPVRSLATRKTWPGGTHACMLLDSGHRSIVDWYRMFSICFLSASRSIAESTLGSMTPPPPPPPAPAYVSQSAAAAAVYTYITRPCTAVVADAAAAVDQRRLFRERPSVHDPHGER